MTVQPALQTLKTGGALGLCLAVALAGAPARAQPAPSEPPAAASPPSLTETLTGEAKEEYEGGKLLFDNGDHAGAALKFQHAYDLAHDPRLLWNVAAAEKYLRHYARVEALLTEYLKASGPALAETDRSNALDLLETVKAFIVDVTFDVSEPGARVLVDDTEIGQTPLPAAQRIDMGSHKIQVVKPGFQNFVATRVFTGGAKAQISVKLSADVHEGRLRISAIPGAAIRVDNKLAGLGEWEGRLTSGSHRIDVTAEGKRAWHSDSVVRDGQITSVLVSLEDTPKAASSAVPAWIWIAGGTVALAGLGAGAYFLFKPEDKGPPPALGGTFTTVELPLFR